MLDLARAAALALTLLLARRCRAWPLVAWLTLFAYVFGLEIGSGFAFPWEDGLLPGTEKLVSILGPSCMPRGDLPPLPLASLIVQWPTLVDAAGSVALVALSRQTSDRRLAYALIGLATLQALSVIARPLQLALGFAQPAE